MRLPRSLFSAQRTSVPSRGLFRDHLRKQVPRLAHMTCRATFRSDVGALLLVESYFRPRYVLATEYLAFRLLSKFHPLRAERLTLGLAQARPHSWRAVGVHINLKALFDIDDNYRVCEGYLSRKGIWGDEECMIAPRSYCGANNRYYIRLFIAARSELNLLRQCQCPDRRGSNEAAIAKSRT